MSRNSALFAPTLTSTSAIVRHRNPFERARITTQTQQLLEKLGKSSKLSAEQMAAFGKETERAAIRAAEARGKAQRRLRGRTGTSVYSTSIADRPAWGRREVKESERWRANPQVRVPRPRLKKHVQSDDEMHNPASFRPGIRPEATILAQRAADNREVVQPPLPCKPISTDMEKRRLQLNNQFKGGKTLPAAGLPAPLEGNVPLSMLQPGWRASRRKQTTKERAQERRRRQDAEMEARFDEICWEVDQLRQRLEDADADGLNSRVVASLQSKLTMRVSEMRDLDELLRHKEH